MNTCLLRKGALREHDMDRLLQVLMTLPKDKAMRVKWGTARSERSLAQNNALFGCAYKFIEEETGNNKYQMHDYFCRHFFGEVEREAFGERRLYPRRTTTKDEDGNDDTISKFEFMQFYSFIQQHMAEKLGLNVPDPDPNWRDHQEAA